MPTSRVAIPVVFPISATSSSSTSTAPTITPSNATLFFYGDADLQEELAFVQERFLSKVSQPVDKACIKEGLEVSALLSIEDSYPVQPGSPTTERTFLAISSVIGTIHDRKLNTAFQIIANILFNSDGSPLKKAVFNAGVCMTLVASSWPTSRSNVDHHLPGGD